MLPLELQSPSEICQEIAQRATALRLERGWTQQELARRSGVALATLRRFERTGQISLERLARIAVVLGAARPLAELFAPGAPRTLADLERPTRRRARAPRRGE